MAKIKLEICVDSLASLQAAKAGGADRIELCAALSEGGLTPSAGFIEAAVATGMDTHVMIRPRGGDFVYSDEELDFMCADIAAVRRTGAAGVVFGATHDDGQLNVEAMKKLVAAANGLEITLHRAIDLAPDMAQAMENAIELGVNRILTSGGHRTAQAGIQKIAHLVKQANDRIEIMPGSGVQPANAERILVETGANSIHASCGAWKKSNTGLVEAMGFTDGLGVRETESGTVAELKSRLQQIAGGIHA